MAADLFEESGVTVERLKLPVVRNYATSSLVVFAFQTIPAVPEAKRLKQDSLDSCFEEQPASGNGNTVDSGPNSPGSVHSADILTDDLTDNYNEDADSPITNSEYTFPLPGPESPQLHSLRHTVVIEFNKYTPA